MDWLTFWTLLLQVIIFIAVTAFPMAIWVMLVAAGARKPERSTGILSGRVK